MQPLFVKGLIIYADHEYSFTTFNGEHHAFHSNDLVFADATQISLNKSLSEDNVISVTKETLLLFLSTINADILNFHFDKKKPPYISHHYVGDITFFQDIKQLSHNAYPRYSEIIRKRALIFALLSIFLENKHFIPLITKILQPSVRFQVCTIINSNIAYEWSLAQIANRLWISPSLLKKKLHAEGVSYSSLLTECRMHKALQLISAQDFSIKKVASLCGYNSVSYFTYVFRNYYGIPPSEYHKLIKTKAANEQTVIDITKHRYSPHHKMITKLAS